ncbi:hypothetical protein PT2222_250137 [Paraburkholderia tropica]
MHCSIRAAGDVRQDAVRLVLAVARQERDAFLPREFGLHFVREPRFEIDLAVVENALRGRRVRIDLAGRERQRLERTRRGLRARVGLADPAARGTAHVEQLREASLRNRLHLRELAHRRDQHQLVDDGSIPFDRRQIAALLVRALVQSGVDFALLHVRLECVRVFSVAQLRAARAAHFEGRHLHAVLVERLLERVQIRADLLDLRGDVGRGQTRLHGFELLRMLGLELLESPIHTVDERLHFGIGAHGHDAARYRREVACQGRREGGNDALLAHGFILEER